MSAFTAGDHWVHVITFTGSARMSPAHEPFVDRVLRDLSHEFGTTATFVTGAQHGVDSYVADFLERACPSARHHIVVPNAPHNTELVGRFEFLASRQANIVVEYMPAPDIWPNHKLRNAVAYRERDQRMVDLAAAAGSHGRVVGFPLMEEHRQRRSGTWLTIRLARKARVPTITVTMLEPRDPVLC